MAMLENEPEISLALLNKATLAWVEFEYHKKSIQRLVQPFYYYLKARCE